MKLWYALILVIFAAVLISPASAWLSGETYGKNIFITGASGWAGSNSNYATLFTIHRSAGTDSGSDIYVGTNCNANYSDLRFTDSSDTLLNYWLEENTTDSSSTKVWVNIPTISKTAATTYHLYYGNASFTSVSNGTTTFTTFDSFTGASLDASKWTSSGTVGIATGQCTITSGAYIETLATFSRANIRILFNGTMNSSTNYDGWTYTDFLYTSSAIKFHYYNSGDQYITTTYVPDTQVRNEIIFAPSDAWNAKAGYAINSSDTITWYNYYSGGSAIPVRFSTGKLNWIAVGNGDYGEPTNTYSDIYPATAQFTANQTTIAPGAWVQFNDTSSGTPDHWWWSFGDGNTSTTRNATAKYWTAGSYNVSLTVQQYGSNSTETKTNYIAVGQPPTASFTSNKTSGQNPLSIAFTDTSTLSPTSWSWSFGEGGANVTTQNATYTYTSSGSYVVMHTATNAYGSTTATATITVQTSNNATGYGQYYASKTTTFHVQSAFGAPVSGATVTMQGLATSTGSWDWLGQLLGLKFNETPVNNNVMTTTTDTNGDAQFLVLPSVRYTVTIYQAGVISKTFTVTPTDDRYTVPLDWSIFGTTGQDVNAVDSFNLTKTIVSDTSVTLTVTGSDTLGHITGGTIVVNQSTNGTETTVYTSAIPVGNFSANIPITGYAGNSYLVHINATQSDYGYVRHDYGVTFPKAKVRPLNLDDKSLFMVSMVILFAVGGIFTATTKDKGALITCFAAWILYALGYLDYAGSNMAVWLILATVISIAFIIAMGAVKR